MDYRREIDGLRALAVLPVIFFHAGFDAFSGGFVGVDVFFVISGYLITSIILAEMQAGTFSLVKFYERRVRRILPALFFVMAICLPLAWVWLLPSDMKDFSSSLMAVSTFSSNILFWKESGYFDSAAELKPLLHTWSLAVEEQYYVLFPLFLMLTWRFGQRWVVGLLIVVAIISLSVAEWKVFVAPMTTFFLLPTRGWELLLGAFIAFYLIKRNIEDPHRHVAAMCSFAGLAMILYAVFFFNSKTPVPGIYALIPTIGAALIILYATPQTLTGKILGSRLFVSIGLVSYSAYLWHQPLFAFARHASLTEPSVPLLILLSISSLILAYFSWRFVEQPFRRKGYISRKAVFVFAISTSLLFIGLGLLGYSTQGFESRYDESDRYLGGIRKADAGEYVGARFENLQLKDFDAEDKRKKVLLIGDSYAKDLVNAVYESELTSHFQLSTHHISARCGNLYLKEDFIAQVASTDLKRCMAAGWYESGKLNKLLRDADIVWLASSWRVWQAELLPRSISNIQRDFDNQVIVFGRKSFGDIQFKKLLQHKNEERLLLENPLSEDHLKVNDLMRSILEPGLFIDVSDVLCKSEKSCRLFTSDGKLISYDGGHLTADGARYYGQELLAHPIIKSLIGTESPK